MGPPPSSPLVGDLARSPTAHTVSLSSSKQHERCSASTARARNDALHRLGNARQGASALCHQRTPNFYLLHQVLDERAACNTRVGRVVATIRGTMVDISHRAQPTAATVDGLLAAPDGDRELAERALAAASSSREHVVRFYEDDARLAEAVTAFLADGLRAGDLVAAIATAAHREAFQRRLDAQGFDVERRVAPGGLYSGR